MLYRHRTNNVSDTLLLTVQVLMANLAKDSKMTLHNACYDAYNRQVTQSMYTFQPHDQHLMVFMPPLM